MNITRVLMVSRLSSFLTCKEVVYRRRNTRQQQSQERKEGYFQALITIASISGIITGGAELGAQARGAAVAGEAGTQRDSAGKESGN